jgi:hypothetical protein
LTRSHEDDVSLQDAAFALGDAVMMERSYVISPFSLVEYEMYFIVDITSSAP